MSLVDRVSRDIVEAMKQKAPARLSALRLLKAALVNRSVEKGRDLDEAEAAQVVASLVKQRREAIEQFRKGSRQDLVDKETAEIRILEEYLPPAASADEIAQAIEAAIAETGASSARDIGRVMKAVMARLAGRTVDGRAVNELVRKRLA